MSPQSRIARLEKAVRDRGSTAQFDERWRVHEERVAASPEGAALLTELQLIRERVVGQDPDGVPDLPTLRLRLLADARAREISCLLAEIEMALE